LDPNKNNIRPKEEKINHIDLVILAFRCRLFIGIFLICRGLSSEICIMVGILGFQKLGVSRWNDFYRNGGGKYKCPWGHGEQIQYHANRFLPLLSCCRACKEGRNNLMLAIAECAIMMLQGF